MHDGRQVLSALRAKRRDAEIFEEVLHHELCETELEKLWFFWGACRHNDEMKMTAVASSLSALCVQCLSPR